MGYSNIKAERQHESDQKRIHELEAALKHERAKNDNCAVAKNSQQAQIPQGGHVTIEKTSKALKSQMLASWLVIIGGIICTLTGDSDGLGPILLIVGIVAVIVTKIQIWWRHG